MVKRNLDDVEFGCKLQNEYIKEKLKKNGFGKMLYNNDDMNKARCKGRVEGAIQELEKIINLLDRFGEDRTPTLSIKRYFEKRLKELEKGGKE